MVLKVPNIFAGKNMVFLIFEYGKYKTKQKL